jgi:hypothetical protein
MGDGKDGAAEWPFCWYMNKSRRKLKKRSKMGGRTKDKPKEKILLN